MDEPDPTRVVADVDVLVADLLVDGEAREALDILRAHSWFELAATETLLEQAEAVIETVADGDLAAAWRSRIDEDATIVDPIARGHPALVAAASGEAATILSYDDRLGSVSAGAKLRPRLATSVKPPDGFVRLVDPASLYETLNEGYYPGPDRDPRG